MRRALSFLVATVVALSFAGAADAQKIDKNGRCHDAKGRFAKAEVCAGVSKAAPAMSPMKADKAAPSAASAAAPTAATAPATKSTKPARCKNDKGRFVKCTAAGAKPA